MSKYIFVVGGVMSGVGKGIASASIGRILQVRGFRVTAVKIDPYINVDAGTMNPIEHGEVFVTDDGDETDQDIGNYERFLNCNIGRINYMTTGRVYQTVISRERNLEFGGRCVEVVPHIPEEVMRRLRLASSRAKADITLVEIGGTIGEYQNILFLEAARMMHLKAPQDILFVLVSYLPIPYNLGEMKTKPTQYAARSLNSAGIQPDIIIARSSKPLDAPRKKKISIFCSVATQDVISAPDTANIYKVPLTYVKERLDSRLLYKLNLKSKKPQWREWRRFVRAAERTKKKVKIGMVAKYIDSGNFTLADSYISVLEAIKHASWADGVTPEIVWISTNSLKRNLSVLRGLHGIIIPQGWGSRGSEEKIRAIEFARKERVPYLGLCYGMQMAVIEFARHKARLKQAHSIEVNPKTKHPVIDTMPEQEKYLAKRQYGGTIRLGSYPCILKKGTLTEQLYGTRRIKERHRHRYEVNPSYRARLEKAGLTVAGTSPDNRLVEIIELTDHPFFIGTQFHPEYKSRPLAPHPLFVGFLKAVSKRA